MSELHFRDVHDGDLIPGEANDRGPKLLRWFCPDLTEEEAEELARRARRYALPYPLGTDRLRAFIEQELPGIRSHKP